MRVSQEDRLALGRLLKVAGAALSFVDVVGGALGDSEAEQAQSDMKRLLAMMEGV